jgi:NAD(P)-dependent dehydrogenase (short-subunit alcohol dehydrogenase family)
MQPRKALITGGASGFGLEIGKRLHAAGAFVALVDRDADAAVAAAAELGADRAAAITADVRSPGDVANAVATVTDLFGGLDTLVISAGIIHFKPLAEVTEADWDAVLDVNLKGAFLCSQAAAPHLVASGRGRIVMISSDAG